MGFLSGVKKFGRIAQKTYAPNNEQRYTKMADKEAKNDIEINMAVNRYAQKTGGDKRRVKAFETKLRKEAAKPKKPFFSNVDKAMNSFDNAFGSSKARLPSNISSPKGYSQKYKKPTSLDDPFGKPF